MGTKVLIDGRGRGSLIMDPSFVEKRFFVRSKRYVLSHLIEAYQAGLRGNLLQVRDKSIMVAQTGNIDRCSAVIVLLVYLHTDELPFGE